MRIAGHRLSPLSALLFALLPREATGTVPPAFVDEIVQGGFVRPVAVEFAPDGRMFVAEQRGMVRIVVAGQTLPVPFIDLVDEVNERVDKGLLGMTLDPDFDSNHYVYLLYSVDRFFGEPDEAAEVPTLGRLTRYTAVGDTADTASRKVLLGSDANDAFACCWYSHAVGALEFGLDGSLFVAAGDGAHHNFPDGGQDSTSFDPFCQGIFGSAQDVGAIRSQVFESLSGKILRVDPETGLGLSDNPFYDGNPRSFASRVWAYGLRNPFRYAVRPDTDGPGALYIADVGWSTYEELNVSPSGGENFGWPCYEGPNPQPLYQSHPNTAPFCQALPAGLVTEPLIPWHHEKAGSLGFTGRTASGVVFYSGTQFPSQYHGVCFFSDFWEGWIKIAHVDSTNQLVAIDDFAEDLGLPADLDVHAATGDLVYVSLSEQSVRRIRYAPVTSAPVVPETAAGSLTIMPNPLREATSISYSLDRDENHAALAIYDARGRRVVTLRNGFMKAGREVVAWDRRDSSGERVAAGVYFVSLEVDGGRRHTRKVTVLE